MTNTNALMAATTVSPGFKIQLDSVWKNNLPIIVDRLDQLDHFVTVIANGSATQQQRSDALIIAHKFTGSLGMFGYPTGSQLARSLEHLIDSTPVPDPKRVKAIVASIRSTLNL